MSRILIFTLFFFVSSRDCWKTVELNSRDAYFIPNEGKLFKPLYSENEETINAYLVINNDTASLIKMCYTSPFPMGDTVKIEAFDNEASFSNSLTVTIFHNKYKIDYKREVNFTDLVQKFGTVKSELVLSSLDFSNLGKIRCHIEYTGKCISGCTEKNKKISIEGNFVTKIHRY